jgi:integrase
MPSRQRGRRCGITSYVEDREKDAVTGRQLPNFRGGKERIKSDLRILHASFNYALDCDYIQRNPVRYKNLSTVGGNMLPFTDEELAAMLQDKYLQKNPMLRALVLTFLFTGLRKSDVQTLPVAALETTAEGMILKTRKRGKVVALVLHTELRAALEHHLAHRHGPYCKSPHIFNGNLYSFIQRLCKRCGIQGGHPHRFRDTFAVRLLDEGGSLYDVANALGITHRVAEQNYTPYVKELQDRASRLVQNMKVPGAPSSEEPTAPDNKVVRFWQAPAKPSKKKSA